MSLKIGFSEIVSTILLLFIAVVLSVIILSTLNAQLGLLSSRDKARPCLLSIYALGNWSDSMLQSLVVYAYNFGDTPCTISSIYLISDGFVKALAGYPKSLDLTLSPYSYVVFRFDDLDVNCVEGCRIRVVTNVGSYVEAPVE